VAETKERIEPGKATRSEVRALIAALIALLGVMLHTVSCGTDDLIFPGDVPPTPTSAATETPDNSDN
jgi:hypothetical protein